MEEEITPQNFDEEKFAKLLADYIARSELLQARLDKTRDEAVKLALAQLNFEIGLIRDDLEQVRGKVGEFSKEGIEDYEKNLKHNENLKFEDKALFQRLLEQFEPEPTEIAERSAETAERPGETVERSAETVERPGETAERPASQTRRPKVKSTNGSQPLNVTSRKRYSHDDITLTKPPKMLELEFKQRQKLVKPQKPSLPPSPPSSEPAYERFQSELFSPRVRSLSATEKPSAKNTPSVPPSREGALQLNPQFTTGTVGSSLFSPTRSQFTLPISPSTIPVDLKSPSKRSLSIDRQPDEPAETRTKLWERLRVGRRSGGTRINKRKTQRFKNNRRAKKWTVARSRGMKRSTLKRR